MTMKRFSHLWIAVLALMVVFLPLTGVAQEIKKGGTAVLGLGSTPASLVPNLSYTISPLIISNLMFEGLVNYDMQGKMVPELAHSWEFSADGLTWTFHLRKGVKWHDGKDLTSEDVAFSIKEVAEKYHPLGKQAFGPISRIETPDPHTVVFKFEKPWSPTVNYLSCWFAGILPKHLYEGTDILKNPYNFKPVGSGPFMFQEYQKDSHAIVVRNPNYWQKGKPYLDKIIAQIVRDGAMRVLGLEKGEIDVLPPYSMPESEIERLRGKGITTEAFFTPAGTMTMFLLNLEDKHLGDRRVRHALAHAIDRQEIIDKAYFGNGRIPVGPIPSSIPWAFTGDVPKFEYDPAKASQMLDEAGYKKGTDGTRFSIDLVYRSGPTDFDRASRIIQSRFRDIGVEVRLRTMERAAVQEEVYKKKTFGMCYESLTMGPDPAVGAGRLYLTSQIRETRGVTNAMGYSNPEVDRLFEDGGSATTKEAAGEKYKQIQRIMVEDTPCFWILERPYAMGFSSKLVGLPAGPFWTEHMESVAWKK